MQEAVAAGPECIQTGVPGVGSRSAALAAMPPLRFDFLRRLAPRLEAQSEDCLYLNLYVPQRQGSFRPLVSLLSRLWAVSPFLFRPE